MRTVLNYEAVFEGASPKIAYELAEIGKTEIPFRADQVKVSVEQMYDPHASEEEGERVWQATLTASGTEW